MLKVLCNNQMNEERHTRWTRLEGEVEVMYERVMQMARAKCFFDVKEKSFGSASDPSSVHFCG